MKTIRNTDLISAINQARSILVFTHLRPDGDAVGSALALYHLFTGMGKDAAVCCQDAPPPRLSYLPAIGVFKTPDEIAGDFDLHLSVDASELSRLGTAVPLFRSGKVTAQIDHHTTNEGFAIHNEIDVQCAAAGMMVMRLANDLGAVLTKDMATCLYTAISTDTGNFCYPSVTGETFEMAGLLCDAGLPLAPVARTLHLMRSAAHIRLLGVALTRLRFLANGRISGMYLTREDFAACRATQEDGEGIVNNGLYIDGVEMAYIATETEGGIRFSLRSIAPRTVSGVSLKFGGGGHALAAGCTIQSDMPEALAMMERALLQELEA